MKNSIAAISFALFLISCSSSRDLIERAVEASERFAPRFENSALAIDSLLADSAFANAFVGIQVVAIDAGEVLYERNAQKLFLPSSNIKLFTTVGALAILGPKYELKTIVYGDSILRDGTIEGQIYLKGYGDPLLTVNDLDSLARKLYSLGIRQIHGGIVGDDFYFDREFWGSGWMWDDDPGSDFPYLSAISVNRNIIRVTILAGNQDGDSIQVLLSPPTSYVKVLSKGITSSDTTQSPLRVTRRWRERENTIVVEGTIRPLAPSMNVDLNVWKPELYALTLFRDRLRANGISLPDSIRIDSTKANRALVEISHQLDSVVTIINKESYNLGAENLLKVMASATGKPPGSAEIGIRLMKNYLAAHGVDTSALVLVDGSGVSRYNLSPPEAIVQLLVDVAKDSAIFQPLYRSLSIAGVDGKLRTRLTKGLASNNARAKTGTHSNASALSGYVRNINGEMLAFSIMMNHFLGSQLPYRNLQDRIVEILARCN